MAPVPVSPQFRLAFPLVSRSVRAIRLEKVFEKIEIIRRLLGTLLVTIGSVSCALQLHRFSRGKTRRHFAAINISLLTE